MLEEFLGVKKYKNEVCAIPTRSDLVRGLAWTSVGGEILDVEVNVMDEPATGAYRKSRRRYERIGKGGLSYIRQQGKAANIDPEFYKNIRYHIHFPEGAVPKDGPSAGITVTLAVISRCPERLSEGISQ
jgi:ATP-dependent Lon protease